MNKITPKIFNGSLEIVLSGTMWCNPKYGLQVHIPVTSEKMAQFHFRFESDSDPSKKGCATSQDGDLLTLILTNFLGSFGASLTIPLEFCIGEDKFFYNFMEQPRGQIVCV